MTPSWLPSSRPHARRAFGGVVLDPRGCVLLRAPTGGYGGYAWTLPKGRAEPGETPEQSALREVLEETGVRAGIVRPLPGWYVGDTTDTRLFVMRVEAVGDRCDAETAAITWAEPADARELIGATRTATGRRRDLAVIDTVERLLAHPTSVLDLGFEGGSVGISRTGRSGRYLWWRRRSTCFSEFLHEDDAVDEPDVVEGPFGTLVDAVRTCRGWSRCSPRLKVLAVGSEP